ncbi:DDB1- and CUL4-associated factor 6-like isoform X3 [Drosophila nasuta]|nr:DDB1- and CUL4-associated factor 6-like isoform X3 [Drosophila nasuta]XP_060661822.1 DDB1- and CUL4-associated factor 6-like isoform X3 [Drosophila nasuta]XP_060661823.1 DDB1- and CUL4-associated factor 6-like isoform X3 [Drosophila nasuta]XP_060661824.1 DDB1- and CUL4-associated factor 6-like isoform X3 [Drosophila nasuta]XP_060661825.1 DDB1- and CUL4-associated factor 6-like isoform X3 [Drosophila nasuta]
MTDRRGLRRSVQQCISDYPYHNANDLQTDLQASCKNSLDFVQRLSLLNKFDVHTGCVNTVNWNASGTHFVSGSDDNHLVITEAKTGRIAVRSKTMHKRHIFSARFMPHTNDQAIVSCSGEGIVMHTEFLAPYGSGKSRPEEALIDDAGRAASLFDCHAFGSTYDVQPLPDCPRTFLSCGEDGTVRCIDLRISSSCMEAVCEQHIFITAPCAVTAMDVAPINYHNIAIGCSDSIVRLYDRRMLTYSTTDRERITWPLKAYPIPMEYTRRHYRPTCVKYSADETELLVSYSMEQLYLYDLRHPGYEDGELLKSGCYTPKLRRDDDPEAQMPRLRFRGDWSDTGPNSMATTEQGQNRLNVGQARPPLEPGVLNRLSDEIFRMLNSQTRPSRPLAASNNSSGGGSGGGGNNGGGGSNNSGSNSTPRSGGGHLSWQDAVMRTLDNRSESALNRSSSQLLTQISMQPGNPIEASSPPTPPPPATATRSPTADGKSEHTITPKCLTMINAEKVTTEAETEATDANQKMDTETTEKSAESEVETEAEADTKEDTDMAEMKGDGPKYPITKFDYVKMSFSGHRNSRTMVKGACFWGDDFIMSGSDCGHIFVWQRQTGKVVKTLLADHRVVNRVQPHPTLPYLLSSGIDYNVKLWAPIDAAASFDEAGTTGLMQSNEIMLVEARDTITVPAQIMIRILASLHQYRRLMHATEGGATAANAAFRQRRNEAIVAMSAGEGGEAEAGAMDTEAMETEAFVTLEVIESDGSGGSSSGSEAANNNNNNHNNDNANDDGDSNGDNNQSNSNSNAT